MIPRLLITSGEPAGIGPELCLRIAQLDWPAELIFITNRSLLNQMAMQLGIEVALNDWRHDPSQSRSEHQPGVIKCLEVPLTEPVIPGQLTQANASHVIQTLEIAAELMRSGHGDAVVTAPVHKGIINDAGFDFTGHTEFFAQRSNCDPVMLLACPEFRVALVTTHLPLRKVADAITAKQLRRVLAIIHDDLQSKYGISDPKIHVCGLNPHAGEGGHLGQEEIQIIEPVIHDLKAQGMRLKGPLPADTALTPKGMQGADVTLAMYHDQGLSVLKFAGFGRAVNITLGLPYIRVSVDHGTALDLAGKGEAECGSMEAAINEALVMINAQS